MYQSAGTVSKGLGYCLASSFAVTHVTVLIDVRTPLTALTTFLIFL